MGFVLLAGEEEDIYKAVITPMLNIFGLGHFFVLLQYLVQVRCGGLTSDGWMNLLVLYGK